MSGWVEQRGSEFRIRLRLGDGRKPVLDSCSSREEAERVLSAALEQMRKADSGPNGVAVATWVSQHLTQRQVAREISDIDRQWGVFRVSIEDDDIGKIALRRLTRGHVIDWTRRVGVNHSRATVLKCLVLLRGALKAARDRGMIKTIVADEIKIPRERRTEDPWTFLTPKEQERFIYAIPNAEKWIAAFAMGTGMRPGELAALRSSDVRCDAEHPHVIVRYGAPRNEPTKNGKIREVPLFGIALQAWQSWIEESRSFIKSNPLDLAFPRVRGSFRDPAHLIRWEYWKAAVDGAGITRPIRWYDATRHTCASSLVSGFWGRAWRLEEIQAMLGHSSYVVTQRYAHLAGTALQAAAKATNPAPILPPATSTPSSKTLVISEAPPTRVELVANALGISPNIFETIGGIDDAGAIGGKVEAALKLLADRDPFAVSAAVDALTLVREFLFRVGTSSDRRAVS